MANKDYYKILGVDKTASEDDIKKAYRRLAHQHHPDKNGGSDEKFKEINEAYQVLSNKEKRAQYDQFGTTFDQAGAGGQGPFGGFGGFGGNGGGFNINFEDLGDMFGDFFGGGRGRGRVQARGEDIVVDFTLTFAEAVLGTEKVISIRRGVACDVCGGSGAEPGTSVKRCITCGGSGQVAQVQRTILGAIQTVATCTTCHGAGTVPEKECRHCHGSGVEKKTSDLTIRIPAGVSDGDTMKFAGKGEASLHRGAPGDLYVRLHVQRDDRFEREGYDLRTTVFVKFSQAVNGGTIEVPTVDGSVKLKIPDGTQSGTIFRVRGKGIADRGDLYVRVEVAVPKRLSRKARKLLEEFEQEGS